MTSQTPPETSLIRRSSYQAIVEELLLNADIRIDGSRPHDIHVVDPRFYKRFLRDGSLGLGESYMDAWWECERIDEMFHRLLEATVYQRLRVHHPKFLPAVVKAKLFPEGAKSRSHLIAKRHYDIGNELYRLMLDKYMVYSCGYWKQARTLDEAQEAKLELTCRKLRLEPGMRVLDVGCGWGGFAKYAAERHRVQVTGITISHEQLAFARQACAGLPVELRYQDYRDVNEVYDRIVSIGMFEHVGLRYHALFMRTMNRCLRDRGLFLLQTIVVNRSKPPDPWLEKYIFPGCRPPSMKEIGRAVEGQFVVEDIHNFGVSYANTGMAWWENVDRNWEQLGSQYDERFYRMWKYYLMSGVGAFRARYSNLWQVVLSKGGIPGGYEFEGNDRLR